MEEEDQLLRLERASIDLMSPPHSVSGGKRKEAEAVFLELKKSKLPYKTCKYILENSQSDFVLFQSVSAIREAIIREWPLLPAEEKAELRTYLLQYLTLRPSLTNYVRSEALHTIALLVKRATLEVEFDKLFRSMLDSIAQLLATGDVRMRQLGCSLLRALMTEYSSSSGSSSIGLPLEFHLQCKKAIEKKHLLQILHFAVQVLQQFLPLSLLSLSQEDHTLLSDFLHLASQILNWDFHQNQRLFRTNPESIHLTLKPPETYASTFLDPSFLFLFFQLLSKLKTREEDFHHAGQCLTQLSSLSKPVFTSDQEQEIYLANFINGVLEYVHSSSELSQQEVYSLSCIVRRLATTFSVDHFSALEASQLETLMRTITRLTCLSAQKAVQEDDEDKSLTYREALEHYLEVCVTFLTFWDSSPSSFPLPESTLTQPMVDIFNSYIQSKLSPPRGWRTDSLPEDDIISIEEDDREIFANELSSIGSIARAIADHSLPLLVNLLEQCLNECVQLGLMIQRDSSILLSSQNHLDGLYEDLHWLGLISGYTLCDIARGEVVQIPTVLMKYSISRQQEQNQGGKGGIPLEGNISARFLEADSASGYGNQGLALSGLDPVVELVLSVCRLCVMEKEFVSLGLMDLLSPQLCETTVWCLSRVTEPYVMFTDENYQQVSLSLVDAFGKDSESGKWLTAFLVNKVAFNMSVWNAEESLSLVSVQLLQSVSKSQIRAGVCIQCDALWTLMHSFSTGSGSLAISLPPQVQKNLMGSLVMCAIGERKKEFLTQLLQPFQTRFTSLVQAPDFPTCCHELDMKWALLAVLEPMCGLAGSIRVAYAQEFFHFLLPILQVSVSLLELYSGQPDVVTVILELFVLVAENYIIFLNQSDTVKLYEVSLNLIQSYAKCNTGKYSKLSLQEEEQCDDLLLFLKLLSHLTSKDFLNFGPVEEQTDPLLSAVKPVDVVVSGMNIVLPLMSEETLKFPKLCSQFFTLLHYMCLDFCDKILTLPDKLVVSFFKLLEMGLTNYTPEICIDSLESIESLVNHYASAPQHYPLQFLLQSFHHFLKVIFEMVLSSSFDMDLIGPASNALYTLICMQQDYYSSLAVALVSSLLCDPQNHARLVQAFQELTPPSLSLDLSRTARQTFRKNLEHFLPSVKGFLFYK